MLGLSKETWEKRATKIQLAFTTVAIVCSVAYTGYTFTTEFLTTRAYADEKFEKFTKEMEKASQERLLNKQFALDLQIYQMERAGDHISENPTIQRLYNNVKKQRLLVDKKLDIYVY